MPLRVRTGKQRTWSRGHERRLRLIRRPSTYRIFVIQFSAVALPHRCESTVGRDLPLDSRLGMAGRTLRSGPFHRRHRPASVHPVKMSERIRTTASGSTVAHVARVRRSVTRSHNSSWDRPPRTRGPSRQATRTCRADRADSPSSARRNRCRPMVANRCCVRRHPG